MLVEIWSDVVCPWCYIGKRRFTSALDILEEAHPGAGAEVEVRYRAFQLDPTAPVGVSEPVAQAYAKKFGGPEAAQAAIDRVTTEAAGEGLEFRLDIAQRANTVDAHRLLALAHEHGLQAELKERLMAAYFTEGKAIGEREVLVGLAADVGLDAEQAGGWLGGDGGRSEVAADLELAVSFGITAVPTFVFDREVGIPGAQPAEMLARALAKRLAAVA